MVGTALQPFGSVYHRNGGSRRASLHREKAKNTDERIGLAKRLAADRNLSRSAALSRPTVGKIRHANRPGWPERPCLARGTKPLPGKEVRGRAHPGREPKQRSEFRTEARPLVCSEAHP